DVCSSDLYSVEIELIIHGNGLFAHEVGLVSQVGQVKQVVRLVQDDVVDICLRVQGGALRLLLINVKSRINNRHVYPLLQLLIRQVLRIRDVLPTADDDGNDTRFNQFLANGFHGGIGIDYGLPCPDVAEVGQPQRIITL